MTAAIHIDAVCDSAKAAKLWGWGKTTQYHAEKNGIIPKGFRINIGGRKKGWFLSEIQAINAARARGASEAELKKLTADLEAKRNEGAK